jgi:hypothetical protein
LTHMPILQHLDNLLVSGPDAMLYNRISKKVELLARIAYKTTEDVPVKISNIDRIRGVEARPEQSHIRYTPSTTQMGSILLELRDEFPQLYVLASKVDNDELRFELLGDISQLQVCVDNALKKI